MCGCCLIVYQRLLDFAQAEAEIARAAVKPRVCVPKVRFFVGVRGEGARWTPMIDLLGLFLVWLEGQQANVVCKVES